MKSHGFLAAVFSISLLAACNSGVKVSLLPHDFKLYNGSTFENTLKVITPGAAVPKGAIALICGQNPYRPGCLVYRPLLDDSGQFNINGTSEVRSFDSLTLVSGSYATDPNIIHQQGNTLFMIKNGYVWTDINPHPFWWQWIADNSDFSAGARNCIYTFKSTDGKNWTNNGLIDAAKIGTGDYGVPQTAKLTIGGFDRTELYQDPWTKQFFVTGHGDGGPMTENLPGNQMKVHDLHNDVIMMAGESGTGWSIIKEVGQGAPMQITSTPNGRFFGFSASGATPMLYYNNDLSKVNKINNGFPVFFQTNGKNDSAKIDNSVPAVILRSIQQTTICRVSTDKQTSIVCVSYSTTNKFGRQEYRFAVVQVDDAHPDQAPTVNNFYSLKAEDEQNNSILYGSFIQPDYVGATGYDNYNNAILFYYIETSVGASPKSRAKYLLFVNSGYATSSMVLYKTGYLSTNADGTPRLFNTTSFGDYMTGGFFEYNSSANFMAQWPEGDGVHANIVTVKK